MVQNSAALQLVDRAQAVRTQTQTRRQTDWCNEVNLIETEMTKAYRKTDRQMGTGMSTKQADGENWRPQHGHTQTCYDLAASRWKRQVEILAK